MYIGFFLAIYKILINIRKTISKLKIVFGGLIENKKCKKLVKAKITNFYTFLHQP